MISEDAKHELLTHLRRSHGRDEGPGRRRPEQDHSAPQVAVRAQARESPGSRAHRQRRSAQQAHLRQARSARGRRSRASAGGNRQGFASTEEQARSSLLERAEKRAHSRKNAWIENGSRKKRAAGAATRKCASALRPRKKRAESPKRKRASKSERERKTAVTAVVTKPVQSRRRAKSCRRQGDALWSTGAAHRPATSVRATRRRTNRVTVGGAPIGGDNDAKHGFEMPTARVVREIAVGEAMSRLENSPQKMAVKATEVIKIMMNMGVMATINQTLDQDTAVSGGRRNGSHPGVAQRKRHRRRSAGRDGFVAGDCSRVRRSLPSWVT